jgi:hypothetical protein
MFKIASFSYDEVPNSFDYEKFNVMKCSVINTITDVLTAWQSTPTSFHTERYLVSK